MSDLLREYFSVLIESLYERIYGDESKEDLLLGRLDKLFEKFTEEERDIVDEVLNEMSLN